MDGRGSNQAGTGIDIEENPLLGFHMTGRRQDSEISIPLLGTMLLELCLWIDTEKCMQRVRFLKPRVGLGCKTAIVAAADRPSVSQAQNSPWRKAAAFSSHRRWTHYAVFSNDQAADRHGRIAGKRNGDVLLGGRQDMTVRPSSRMGVLRSSSTMDQQSRSRRVVLLFPSMGSRSSSEELLPCRTSRQNS